MHRRKIQRAPFRAGGSAVIPIKLLKLEDGFHLLINIRVNGKAARLLIDTGASKTVFDMEKSKRFITSGSFEDHDKLSTGLGTSTMKSHLALIGMISLGKIGIRNYKTIVIDLSHVNVAYERLNQKPIDGVLGSDILKKHKAVIDYGAKALKLQVRG